MNIQDDESIDISTIFAAQLARNRSPVPGDPDTRVPAEYGIEATLSGMVIDIRLTFLSGRAYCCIEPGCHLDLPPTSKWPQTRDRLAAAGIVVPDGLLKANVHGLIEEGALFFDFSRPIELNRPGRFYHFQPHSSYQYDAKREEGTGAYWADRLAEIRRAKEAERDKPTDPPGT